MLFTVTITRRLWEYAFLPSRYAAILAGDCISLLFPLFHACIHLEGIFQLGPCVSDHFREFVLTKVYTCQHDRVPAECICWLTGLLFAINFLQYLHQCRCCETQKSALQCVLLFRKIRYERIRCLYLHYCSTARVENGKWKGKESQSPAFFFCIFSLLPPYILRLGRENKGRSSMSDSDEFDVHIRTRSNEEEEYVRPAIRRYLWRLRSMPCWKLIDGKISFSFLT